MSYRKSNHDWRHLKPQDWPTLQLSQDNFLSSMIFLQEKIVHIIILLLLLSYVQRQHKKATYTAENLVSSESHDDIEDERTSFIERMIQRMVDQVIKTTFWQSIKVAVLQFVNSSNHGCY